jgi:predicted nucleotidyltransferase
MQYSQRETSTSIVAAKTLEEVRRIVLGVVSERNVRVYLFGSWARGEASRLSDIDVAIDPQIALPRGTLAQLREQLEESHIPYRVDVVDLSHVSSEFRQRVIAEGVLWNA